MLEELGSHPAGIVRIIRKATCRNPDERYPFLDDLLADLDRYRQHAQVGMVHPEVEDRNTGILSVVPEAPQEPETQAAPETEIPKAVENKHAALSQPLQTQRFLRAVALAMALAGIAFLVTDHLAAQKGIRPLTPVESEGLSSFIREASVSETRPPMLFAQVDESWELLSAERRREEAEALFREANDRWGTRDGFIHRGSAVVAQCWAHEVKIFGSVHGDTK
jgi:hypothetical protein